MPPPSAQSSGPMGPGGLSETREALRAMATTALADDRWQRWRPVLDTIAVAGFVVLMTLLLMQPGGGRVAQPDIDTVAQSTVRAGRDVLVEDQSATQARRDQVLASVGAYFDYDSDLYFGLGDHVFQAFVTLKTRKDEAAKSISERRASFQEELGVPVNSGVFALIEGLAATSETTDVALAINFFLNMGLDRLVVADRSSLPAAAGLEIWDTSLKHIDRRDNASGIIDLRQLRRLMTARAGDAPYGEARIVRSWILSAAQKLARPNLKPNQVAAEKRRTEAVAGVEPVFLRIKAGEVIVRRGDRVTATAWRRIGILNEHAVGRQVWREVVAIAGLLIGFLLLGAIFFSRARVPLSFGRKSTYLTLTIIAATTAIGVAMFYAGLGFADGMGFDPDAAAYFVPLALATVLVSLLVDARTSLLVGVVLTLFLAYRVNGDLWLVTNYIVGVLVAGIAARRSRRRIDLLRIGLMVALAQVAIVPVTVTLAGHTMGSEHLPLMLGAVFSGLLVGVATLGLLPALELLFDETTDTRLLELASADNPLLKDLALKAPGTYYHSTMVANLAEAGAEAVGANGLMCRVMALYHDIGKLQRPAYFMENQRGTENIHDRLAPDVSARIIFHHILDGLVMAKKAKLGRLILEGIAQHQGTTLLRVFHEKAKAQGFNGPEDEYRYPGPRPQRREAGILLLADSIEAATRALKDPSAATVGERVRQVIEFRVGEGELDDCNLTLRDLDIIEATFTRTLTLGVFHNRIDYPPMANPGGSLPEGDADNNAGNNTDGDADGDADRDHRVHPLPGVADRPA
ncbi:MAG: HDIG domain-containing protein [Rhodospirillaceae bacterium]|nr:HDIG domain-containing protein [Rhodospirillaceae bacterium]MBT4687612.1 HDIG domain-containing protein [Rhodospirillaceae bacterium]MBT5082028.1 HDIG domain-containing protein [Rhodospirillaceae bacterium]MBT5524764.1 HDIG domain-containing protein [Rhodospirillaceae bacterium]MBT5881195.1 HDIG domain-containing protein [Rhodospirillaceae bacterium]